MSLSVEGSVRTDGDSFKEGLQKKNLVMDGRNIGPGGGSGGTVLLFLRALTLSESGILSSVGGHGSPSGGGGGGGGRIHFHWSDIPTGDMYQQIASVNGTIHTGLVLNSSQTDIVAYQIFGMQYSVEVDNMFSNNDLRLIIFYHYSLRILCTFQFQIIVYSWMIKLKKFLLIFVISKNFARK